MQSSNFSATFLNQELIEGMNGLTNGDRLVDFEQLGTEGDTVFDALDFVCADVNQRELWGFD